MKMKKKCFKCGEVKFLLEYYTHKKMKDGHLNKCKICTRKDSKKNSERLLEDPEWHEKEKARHREKYRRLNYKDKHKPAIEKRRQYIKKYREKYPEKHKAKNSTQRMKRIMKENQLHHWSYNEEHYKDVIELSVRDHATLHRLTVYDQERKMYRTTENVLLDTREAVLKYCTDIGVTPVLCSTSVGKM